MTNPADRSINRRTVLRGAILAGGALAVPGLFSGGRAFADPTGSGPALVRPDRPLLTHGVQAGDVTSSAGTVWTRTDRPARMLIEVSTRPDLKNARRIDGPTLTPETDFTGKQLLRGLPDGEDIYYRITPVDLSDRTLTGEPLVGRFRTAPRQARDVSFLWSGDLAGQGWGIDVDRGGFRIFAAMRDLTPDFYICNGDNLYADGPLVEQVPLPDGTVWRNLVTPEKSKVAETLDEYRGNYKYNLLDDNLRAFYAEVAQIQQWDDHETVNNWYPGEILDLPQYTEKRVDVLAERAGQAFHEYTPIAPDNDGGVRRVIHYGPLLDVFVLDMRTFRDPNSANDQTTDNGGILGAEQAEWLKRELTKSKATWKVVSNDIPLGYTVPDGPAQEGVSQGDPNDPLGREIQIAGILSHIKRKKVRNVVWVTTDVHFTAALHFDPARAAYQDFDPFWQFVSGPLNAGGFGPNALDGTFGPEQVFVKAPPVANASPATEYQFFGQVAVDGDSGILTVNLRDNSGAVLWSTDIQPQDH